MSYSTYVDSVLRYGFIMGGNSTKVDRAFVSQKVPGQCVDCKWTNHVNHSLKTLAS